MGVVKYFESTLVREGNDEVEAMSIKKIARLTNVVKGKNVLTRI